MDDADSRRGDHTRVRRIETNDATALIACRVRDRYLFPLLIDEIPDGPEALGWEVDTAAVDAAVARAFERYKVVGFYADPPYWLDYVDHWAPSSATGCRCTPQRSTSIAWYTKRDVQMAEALERLHTAVSAGEMGHDDETPLGRALTRHVLNARRTGTAAAGPSSARRGRTRLGRSTRPSRLRSRSRRLLTTSRSECPRSSPRRPVRDPMTRRRCSCCLRPMSAPTTGGC
jgi:hypothetical protein